MTVSGAPKIILITDDAAEEAHASHILKKYHFTNQLLKLKSASDALRYFTAWNSPISDASEALPELFLMSITKSAANNLAVALESRTGVLAKVPLILAVDADADAAAIRNSHLAKTCCISRPVGFFKLLEAMQKLGMRWIVLKPED